MQQRTAHPCAWRELPELRRAGARVVLAPGIVDRRLRAPDPVSRARVSNPFRFEGPFDLPVLMGRDTAVEALVGYALDRRVATVAAPRRYGKTSLLHAVGGILQTEHDFLVSYLLSRNLRSRARRVAHLPAQ